MFKHNHVPSHKGLQTTTEPVKSLDKMTEIKAYLAHSVRYSALWAVAVNSALRAGDLCRLTWEQTHDDGEVITLRVLEGKTKKPRTIPLNTNASALLRAWRRECESEYVYGGQRGPMTTAHLGRLVKDWCSAVGLEGAYAGHTTRKSFVRLQHDEFGTSMATLMEVLNHSNERQTMRYMGKLGDDVMRAYSHSL